MYVCMQLNIFCSKSAPHLKHFRVNKIVVIFCQLYYFLFKSKPPMPIVFCYYGKLQTFINRLSFFSEFNTFMMRLTPVSDFQNPFKSHFLSLLFDRSVIFRTINWFQFFLVFTPIALLIIAII